MRTLPLIIGILLIAVYYFTCIYTYEGYETLEDKIVNRANPLANLQNPLANPAVNIGIPEAAGAQLTNMNQMALNVPDLVPTGGSFIQTAGTDRISPRVDNENSYLGMVRMCKEKGVGNSPFSDPAFAENCGMCLTSGTLKTGEIFNTPTGVLVYAEDKADFTREKEKNGYLFPRAIPSVNGGTCDRATRSDNSEPVLAITQKDYNAFTKRIACKATHTFGNGCAQCISNKAFSWIDPDGGKESINLWLWGSGSVVVMLGGQIVLGNDAKLSIDKSTQVSFGRVAEGTTLSITVKQLVDSSGNPILSSDSPYLYGFISSLTPNNKMYKLPLDKFLDMDNSSGTSIKKGASKYFSDVSAYAAKILPQANKNIMSPSGFIPLTFVVSEELAVYDCPTAPLVSSQASAELMINDPCLNPRGQGPGTYTNACLKQSVLVAGCSTNGDWYKNPQIPATSTLASWISWLRSQNDTLGKTDPTVSKGCSGIDISTPCDPYINGGTPNKACMEYLYSNKSERRGGRAYNRAGTDYTSKNGRSYQFCQPAGTLNPANANGLAALQSAASNYNGLTGIEAVRRFLSDVFAKATGDLDINIPDVYGGRKDSWRQCINMPVEDMPADPVNKNSRGSVLNNALPSPPTAPSTPSINMTNSGYYDNNYTLNVNWSASDNGAPITSYIVSLSGAGQWTVPFTSARYGPSQGINVLPNTNYTFTVIAINEIGQSPRASASIVTSGKAPDPVPQVPPARVPGPVPFFTHNSSGLFSWAPPADNGGSPIIGYYVEPGVNWGGYTGNVTSSQIYNLHQFKGPYTIRAINTYGMGPGVTDYV